MNKLNRLMNVLIHSKDFIKLLNESSPKDAIKVITHHKPLLIFWISPSGELIDVKNSHFDSPPSNDRSILSDPKHKGYLRGRAAYIGDKIYVVIYTSPGGISMYQLGLLKISYVSILNKLKERVKHKKDIDTANFITEFGEDIEL